MAKARKGREIQTEDFTEPYECPMFYLDKKARKDARGGCEHPEASLDNVCGTRYGIVPVHCPWRLRGAKAIFYRYRKPTGVER